MKSSPDQKSSKHTYALICLFADDSIFIKCIHPSQGICFYCGLINNCFFINIVTESLSLTPER